MSPASVISLLWLCIVLCTVRAHDHDEVSEEDSRKPIDAILWLHIAIQLVAWGLVFPTGMVLGLVRQKFHVPLQLSGFLLTGVGIVLGHLHGGRKFNPSAHEKLGSFILLPIMSQLLLGIYLKLHIHEGSRLRHLCVKMHGVIGFTYPLLGWIQMLLGAVVLQEYCRGDNLAQCLAHYIMGGSFVAYGILMIVLLQIGGGWLARNNKSPEWYDSWIIMIWGIVNTFTEHRGSHWSHKDMQHTSLGILWWTGGLLGIWTARHAKRSIIPATIVLLTGWAMSFHSQSTDTSTRVHRTFGFTLGLAGVTRIMEITAFSSSSSTSVIPFQHLPPLLLIASGLLFMSATDEELSVVDKIGMDNVTYTLVIFSVSFIIYFVVNVLLHLYTTTGVNASRPLTDSAAPYQQLRNTGNYEELEDARGGYQMSPTAVTSGSDIEEFK